MGPPRRPPTLFAAAALIITLLSAASGPAAAIYEDQAGTFDWYKQFVGRPQSVLFSPGKERVFLSTQENLLASLHTRGGGAVAWRRHYPQPQDSLDGVLLLQSPSLALAASNGGKTLRAWDAMDGGFRWEALVYEGPAVAGSPGLAAVPLEGHKYPPVAVAAGNSIKLLSAAKGEELWTATLDDAAADASHKLLLAVGTDVALVAYTPGSRHLAVVTYAAADGSSSGQVQQVSAAAELGSTAAISGSSVAVLSEDGQQLCVLPSPGAGSVSCERLSSLAPRLGGSSQLRLAAAAPGSFVVSSPAGVALISVSSSGAMEQVHWAAGAAAAPAATAGTSSSSSSASDAILGVVAASADASSLNIQLLSAASVEQLETAELQLPAPTYPLSGPAATVVAAWLDSSKRKDTPSSSSSSSSGVLSGCRLLVLWSDDQLTYVEDGEVVWSREEALASVSSNLISELPSAKATLSSGDEQDDSSSSSSTTSSSGKGGLLGLLQDRERLKQWVRLQVLGVYVQFKLNTDAEKEEFYALRQALSDNNLPYRDTNGFRKLIVVLTGPGKVFGLHSGDGRILWASNAAALPPAASSSSSSSSSSKQYLRVWRRFHDLTHAPQVVVLTAGQQQSGAHVLNAHTGQQLQHIELAYGVEKVIPVQAPVHDGAAEQFSFLLVEQQQQQQHATDSSSDDSDQLPTPRVHVLPDTPSVTAAVAAGASNTFFWLQQQQQQQEADATTADTVLQGFSLAAGAAADGKGLLPVVPAWRVVLPGKLLAMASRDPTEPVHSYVKILGDRSLKYKYINPNLLFVATAPSSSPTAASAAASGGKAVPAEEQQVSVALINTVSGAVLHQQVHTGAAGPVHAAVSEHWVVYTLWDVVNLRQQVSVIELYDASPRDLSIESILLGRTQHAERLSSYSQLSLEVLSQSFYLQHAVTGLGVSQTLQGITTKQLLLHTQSQQLYALDKRYLDPRRPVAAKSTPQQAEEGLLPYSELVIFNTLMYPTQDKQVMNLRGVSSAPAVLESTSLLFCYGSDLFFTRITPAAHFDSLQSDFSYGLLVVALLGLTVGTLVMRRSSENAMVKAKWQ